MKLKKHILVIALVVLFCALLGFFMWIFVSSKNEEIQDASNQKVQSLPFVYAGYEFYYYGDDITFSEDIVELGADVLQYKDSEGVMHNLSYNESRSAVIKKTDDGYQKVSQSFILNAPDYSQDVICDEEGCRLSEPEVVCEFDPPYLPERIYAKTVSDYIEEMSQGDSEGVMPTLEEVAIDTFIWAMLEDGIERKVLLKYLSKPETFNSDGAYSETLDEAARVLKRKIDAQCFEQTDEFIEEETQAVLEVM